MSEFRKALGAFEISRIEEVVGPLVRPGQWFGEFARAELDAALSRMPPHYYDQLTDHMISSVHSWVVRGGGKIILIDTCTGNHKSRPGWSIFHMLNYPYLERLRAVGIGPDQVDMVMCTHLHVDHVGWNTKLENGRWVPTFPNARYLMGRTELETYQNLVAQSDGSQVEICTYNDSVLPVLEAGQVEMVAESDRIMPGMQLMPTPGHTRGHLAIALESGGERVLFGGDVFHFPVQIPLWHWPTVTDKDPARGCATRRAVLEHCAETGSLLLPAHFPTPHGGYIENQGGNFAISFQGVMDGH